MRLWRRTTIFYDKFVTVSQYCTPLRGWQARGPLNTPLHVIKLVKILRGAWARGSAHPVGVQGKTPLAPMAKDHRRRVGWGWEGVAYLPSQVTWRPGECRELPSEAPIQSDSCRRFNRLVTWPAVSIILCKSGVCTLLYIDGQFLPLHALAM